MITALWLCTPTFAAERGVERVKSLPPGIEAVFAERRVALVVGIDHYADETVPSLSYAGRDAEAFADVLGDPTLGGFHEVHTLQGSVDLDAFWRGFEQVTADLDRSDTFVLYFAGHGTLTWATATETALYLLPSDADLDQVTQTGVALADLETALQTLGTERRVVVLDTCYSGLGRSQHSAETAKTLGATRGLPPTADVVSLSSRYEARLYAAAHHEPAREDDALGNGVYTHFLVDGLRSGAADLDGDGRVELLEAHWWAQEQTVRHTGQAQHPWMEVTQVGAEWLYLSGDDGTGRAAAAILVVPDPQVTARGLQAPAEVYVDGQPRVSGGLAPGEHLFEVRQAGKSQISARVDVRPGDRVDIAAWLDRHRGRNSTALTTVDAMQGGNLALSARLGVGKTSPPTLSSAWSVAGGFELRPRTVGLHAALRATFTADLSAEDVAARSSVLSSRMTGGTVTLGPEIGSRWSLGLGGTTGVVWRILGVPADRSTARDQLGWVVGGTLDGRAPVVGPLSAWASASLLAYPLWSAIFAFPTASAGLAVEL